MAKTTKTTKTNESNQTHEETKSDATQIKSVAKIVLEWKGPFHLVQIPPEPNERDPHWEWRTNSDQLLNFPTENGYFIYQIYGRHIISGENTMLYIGQTDNIPRRLDQHFSWLKNEQNIKMHYAEIPENAYILCINSGYSPHSLTAKEKKLYFNKIENLAIWWHSPPYNSKQINTYFPTDERIIVQNYGQLGALNYEFSDFWDNWPSISRGPDNNPKENSSRV